MTPRYDPLLMRASLQLAKAEVAVANLRQHIEQSTDACTRSLQLLKRTVPVLRHAEEVRPGEAGQDKES